MEVMEVTWLFDRKHRRGILIGCVLPLGKKRTMER